MASKLAERVLEYLADRKEANSLDLVGVLDDDHQKIIGAIKSLQSLPDVITVEQASRRQWELTDEGRHVAENGSHEALLYNAIPEDGIAQAEITKALPYAKVGLSKALQAGWVKLEKRDTIGFLVRNVPSIVDVTQMHLRNLDQVSDSIKAEYKKRKMLQEVIIKSSIVRKGTNFSTTIEKQEADLTADLLASGAWKEKKFKPYNFEALGTALEVGHLHPLLKVRTEFRKIFLEMGFTEMPTNNFVESSFWNFDALFQPQQHPARDAHDTFFVSEPRTSSNFPKDYMEKVRKVHSKGGYGSQGYRYDWKIEEAQKNLLRTHTTAVSARMLYKLMQEGEFKPVRYFSIDRVFRNETLDATHLAEFHQVEGVVADYNLTLGDLIGTLYEFFKKLGIEELEFKPAYNPYTEPSMEIFCFHKGLGKWIEIGNSGVFRPEMLLPMGLPENVNVIAWGLSLERPTMIKYDINNIRDLVGPKVDLRMVYNNPVCRLEKNGPRLSLVRRSHRAALTAPSERQELVVFCDPKYPAYSLESLLRLGREKLRPTVAIYTHSSVHEKSLPVTTTNFCRDFASAISSSELHVDFIWSTVGLDPLMRLPGNRDIRGEVNIARHLNRLIEAKSPGTLTYEARGAIYANKIDHVLDTIHAILHDADKRGLKSLESTKNRYILGDEITLADVILESRCLGRRDR